MERLCRHVMTTFKYTHGKFPNQADKKSKKKIKSTAFYNKRAGKSIQKGQV